MNQYTGQRVLALDVGEKRIGVAMTDADGRFASPLTTIATRSGAVAQALQRIVALVQEHGVDRVVVGLPLTMSGDIGPQARLVQTFATELEQTLNNVTGGSVPVLLFDERLTSVVAEQMLRDMGVKPARRKARIDEVAASIILQDYLDHCRNNRQNP
ncbi:MAG: Holliday junction resolvase RuvX [Chloroflexaceae bacterium]|nr:Holliday junction resolvase RuvX [Chloroflexaceae bacterium]